MCSLYVGYAYVVSYLKDKALEQVHKHLKRSDHHYGLSAEEIENLMTIAAIEIKFDPLPEAPSYTHGSSSGGIW
jgi:hypothetical protein